MEKNAVISAVSSQELDCLRRLSGLFGPTGCEDRVLAFLGEELEKLGVEAAFDRMGNLICRMRFGGAGEEPLPRLMISAHTDEVGFMITEITEEGYLRFGNLGGIDTAVLPGKRVTVLSDAGLLRGVIASKAIHHKDKKEREKGVKAEKLYIDIGAGSREVAETMVSVGDFATFASEFFLMGEGERVCAKGKALDDRMGCCAMLEVIRRLTECPPPVAAEVFFCFTVREEIGLSGARVAANELAPDYALILETTAIGDIADAPDARRVATFGGGGVISVMDRSTVYDRRFVDFALSLAEREKIPAQVKRYVSGGNDAGSIHKTGEGVRCLALSVPTRYLHSPACVARLSDYAAVRDLCEAIVRNPDALFRED